jgi:hypothetical protein
MRKYMAFILLAAIALTAGCSSVPSNYLTPQKTLSINDAAVFEKDGVTFTARIDKVEVIPSSSGSREVTITIGVKNSGTKGVSLIAYPRITDATGKEYMGRSIFFGQLGTGGNTKGKSTVVIPTSAEYDTLLQEAYIKVRFQDITPVPSEGIWKIDLQSLA